MQTQTTSDDEQAFRRFLIAALQEDQQDVKTEFSNFASSMIRLALECGATVQDFDKPSAEAAFSLYGQQIGERIMQRAMERAGIMGTGR